MSRTGPLWEYLADMQEWDALHFRIWLRYEVPFEPAWKTPGERKRTAHGFAAHRLGHLFRHSGRGA